MQERDVCNEGFEPQGRCTGREALAGKRGNQTAEHFAPTHQCIRQCFRRLSSRPHQSGDDTASSHKPHKLMRIVNCFKQVRQVEMHSTAVIMYGSHHEPERAG